VTAVVSGHEGLPAHRPTKLTFDDIVSKRRDLPYRSWITVKNPASLAELRNDQANP
jgi:hypothetical protein